MNRFMRIAKSKWKLMKVEIYYGLQKGWEVIGFLILSCSLTSFEVQKIQEKIEIEMLILEKDF